MANILVPWFKINGKSSYPAGVETVQEEVVINGIKYYVGTGSNSAEIGSSSYSDYEMSLITPVVPLTNVVITNAVLHSSIYWVAENTAMVITGNVALPDGDYMLMAERVVDATQVVDDARFIATVLAGVMTINVTFKSTGNYKFSAARLNRGLDRIGAGVHLSFADIEFDVYV